MLIRGDRSVDLQINDTNSPETVLRTKGKVYTGDFIYNNANLNLSSDGAFSLVGNPYQAPVDMKLVLDSSTNINKEFYWVWDPYLSGTEFGGFVTVELSETTNYNGTSFPSRYLQAFKSAFVQNIDGDENKPTTLTFKESFKSVDHSVPNNEAYSTDLTKRFRVNLHQQSSELNYDNLVDGTMVRFSSEYSNDIDLQDAAKLFTNGEELATKLNGNRFSIQSRAQVQVGDSIFLDVTKYSKLDYTLRFQLDELQGLDAFLLDQYTNEQILIDSSDFRYDFTVDSPEAKESDRFIIVFDDSTLSNPSFTEVNFKMYPNPTQDYFQIDFNDEINDAELRIFNLTGQKINDFKASKTESGFIVNLNRKLTPGVYIVELVSENFHHSEKLVIY